MDVNENKNLDETEIEDLKNSEESENLKINEEPEENKQDENDDFLELDYDEEMENETKEPQSDKKSDEKLENDEELKITSKNLWISGIDNTMKMTHLKSAFEPFGKVDSGKIVLIAKNEKCYGFVKMETLEGANDVIEKLNDTKINGQKVTIEKIISDPTLKAGQSEVTSSDSKVTSSDLRKASREKTPK